MEVILSKDKKKNSGTLFPGEGFGGNARRGHCDRRARHQTDLQLPGGRRFHFLDPGGNELAAMQVDAK